MTQQSFFSVVSNETLTTNVYKMVLSGDTSAVTAPGQFINILLDGFYLRRPISVCDLKGELLTIIYKAVGRGTRYMSSLLPGAKLDILTGLGNGYDISKCGETPLLIGGGVGVPPLYYLSKKLIADGKAPKVLLGFNTASEVFFADEFRALGLPVYISTADGSLGTKGFVTQLLDECGEYDYLFTCGPEPMLKSVYSAADVSGQFSFERRMGCGFGACMGCSCETKYGTKRICRDGPVLEKEEIIW